MTERTHDEEEELLRSVAIQNAQSILLARQRAEEDLQRANELVRTIAENAASSLLMLDERGVATYMNPAAIEETGYSFEEFSRAPFHDLLHPPPERGGHVAADCAIRNARERMVPLKKHRDLFVRKNGSTFPVSCSLSPLQRQGRAAGAVLEFRDISDELAAQKALEDANRRKDEFLATLSHELRTPMTAVLGWARMLKLGLPGTDMRQAIEAIEKSAEIQAQLIDDVLDVSRIAAGRMTFIPATVELPSVLQAALTTIHPAAAAKSIEILSSIPPQLPHILGDEGRLQQIFWNLLSNAVKFTPRGGTITVRVVVAEIILRITVQDSGKGIDPAFLPHVFEPFTQQDGSSTRSHEGIGLGLSIVRSLVELHGGRIRASSDGVGLGATFVVELPFIESEAVGPLQVGTVPPMPAGTSVELPSLHGVSVLVVDDQEITRDVLRAIFLRAQADVRVAASVREGLARFQEEVPHIVICDLAMPEEDGYVFLRAVRALPTTARNTPIIALTAFGRPEERQNAIGAGFDEYLKKPVAPQELIVTAQRLAQSQRA
ncbi:MAG TPA: ATP-binding protein [Thermoanaerobaculia bacterium]|nr:ATP-binding protein [Thermoanaerobaculia bacterium]